MITVRFLVRSVSLVLVGWGVMTGYKYFFDRSRATIFFSGIEEGEWYGEEITCAIRADKVGMASVEIDGQPYGKILTVASRLKEYPFDISTEHLSDGEHTVKIAFVDTTFNKNRSTIERSFYIDNVPLKAAFVAGITDYKVFQGRTLHVKFQVNKQIASAKVITLSQDFQCFPESEQSFFYECFVPVACEEKPGERLLEINAVDRVGNVAVLTNKVQVMAYSFKRERLEVSREKTKKERSLGKPSRELSDSIQKLVALSPREKLWKGSFCAPIDIMRVSCEFGTIRTTQEKGRYMHKAVDVLNAPKSVVWSPQDGVVVLKDRFEDSGNTVVIDHGWGVQTLLFHLDEFAEIEEGQLIAQGNPLGTLGKTGYATGYHLHWEMRINNIAVDPLQWIKEDF